MARSSVVLPDPFAPITAVWLPDSNRPLSPDRMTRLPMAQFDVMQRDHSAHSTATQTQARTAAARTSRDVAPAVGDSGSIMVTV